MRDAIIATVLSAGRGLGTTVYPTPRGCGFLANVTGVNLSVEVTLPQSGASSWAIRSVHVLPLDLGLLCFGQRPAAYFWEAFSVQADEPNRARQLLREDVRHALMELWRMTLPAHSLSLGDRCLTLNVTPERREFASLEHLLFVLRHFAWISRLLRRAAEYVDPPSSLADVYRSFRERGSAVGLQLSTAPLALAGSRGSIACRARVKRSVAFRYRLVMEGVAPRRLGAKMALRPRSSLMDRAVADRRASSFQDPVFERMFEVFAEQPQILHKHLTAEARRRFVALALYGAVSASDSGVRVDSENIMRETPRVL